MCKMTKFEHSVFEALQEVYPENEWMVFPQLRMSTGFDNMYGGDRVIDFWAMNLFPSKGHKTIAFECKASMRDFNKDLAMLLAASRPSNAAVTTKSAPLKQSPPA